MAEQPPALPPCYVAPVRSAAPGVCDLAVEDRHAFDLEQVVRPRHPDDLHAGSRWVGVAPELRTDVAQGGEAAAAEVEAALEGVGLFERDAAPWREACSSQPSSAPGAPSVTW